jgi:hypothetical protein
MLTNSDDVTVSIAITGIEHSYMVTAKRDITIFFFQSTRIIG